MRGLVAIAAAAAFAVGSGDAAAAATGRLLVTVRPGVDVEALLQRAGVRVAGPRIPQLSVLTVRPAAGPDAALALRRLRADAAVRHVEAEHRFELRGLPSDPALGARQAGAPLQWPLLRSRFHRAWRLTRGAGAVVAILDTGVDAAHPDLEGKLAGAVDLDDERPGPATEDPDGHGTHVGSLACAATGNGIGIAGAGRDCRLLALRTDLTDASVAKGIVTAADAGADVLNMSFGDDGSHPSRVLSEAVDYALARDVVLVAAAADEPVGEQGEPANLLQPTGTGPDLGAGRGLSVTAATHAGRRAAFAGHGTQLSLAAYGALRDGQRPLGIIGLYPAAVTPREVGGAPCGCRTRLAGDDRYAMLAGTSMAAPQVAAAAALVRSLNPDLGALDVVRLLKAAARGDGWRPGVGWGVLDAAAAVRAAQRLDRRPPSSHARVARSAGERHRLAWRASDPAPGRLVPSGVARSELWGSVDGGPARRLATTPAPRRRVRVPAGRRASFFTIAVDRAGNREAVPAVPDVVLTG